MKNYKYLDLATVAFVVALLLSNFAGNSKIAQVSNLSFTAGVILFPLSYLIGDILTEVYGYSKSRRVIWIGFGALTISVLFIEFMISLPPAKGWPNQKAYELIFSNSYRVAAASMFAFWIGEFVNSFVLAKMKILTKGKYLWTRTIGSTIVGQAVDSIVFYPLAFCGLSSFPWHLIYSVMVTNFVLKVLWEVLATPITYLVVDFLKKHEHEDFYDDKTDFNPFSIKG